MIPTADCMQCNCYFLEMLLAKNQTSQAVEAMKELGDFLYNIGNVRYEILLVLLQR